MNYPQALTIARRLVSLLEPNCKRIQIAGSVRRQKAEVGDIEICAIPRMELRPLRSLLDNTLASLCAFDCDGIRLKLIKGGDKYRQYWISTDAGYSMAIKLDLFLCIPPAWWGAELLIRTGPAEFSHWMVTQRFLGGALPNGYQVKDLTVRNMKTGEVIPMAEERDYFSFCRLPFIAPENRSPHWNRAGRNLSLSKAGF